MCGLTVLSDFWSVKFYPYTQPGVDPVFAVAGGKRVGHLCRALTASDVTSDTSVPASGKRKSKDGGHSADCG
jgi:hypothetical protein